MKIATTALKTYLDSNNTVVVCDLYTFNLVGIGLVRYADYPLAQLAIPQSSFPDPNSLNYGTGTSTFIRGPRFGRTKVSTKVGIEPAEVDIECFAAPVFAAEPENTIGDLSFQQFALLGGFDGAIVEIDRFFFPANGSTLGPGDGFTGPLNFSLGSIIWFYGKMADVNIERSKITFKVKALINVLQQQQMPRRIFQAGCTHIFGDAMCAYNRVDGKNALGTSTGFGAETILAAAGSSQTDIILASGASYDFAQGSCAGLSGANNGITRGILSNTTSTVIVLSRPFPFSVAVGDGFQLLPGCDHTLSTCNGTFQNILRFGGFPYIPPPEISV
jgi:hypothetical protein